MLEAFVLIQNEVGRGAHVARAIRDMVVRGDWAGDGRPSDRYFHTVYEPERGANGEIIGVMVFGFESSSIPAI